MLKKMVKRLRKIEEKNNTKIIYYLGKDFFLYIIFLINFYLKRDLCEKRNRMKRRTFKYNKDTNKICNKNEEKTKTKTNKKKKKTLKKKT